MDLKKYSLTNKTRLCTILTNGGKFMDNNRLTSYYFAVELDGIQTVSFTECSGLVAETTIYEIEEGGYNLSTRKFLGRNRYPNLVLRKGISKSNLIQRWCKSWSNRNSNEKPERKT